MKITVLTEKVNTIDSFSRFISPVRVFFYRIKVEGLSHIKKVFKALVEEKKYTGHYAVTRSFCEGLKQMQIPFNYNPDYSFFVKKNVIVLADIEALKSAIELKQQGKIDRLFAGPNLMVRSNEYNNILANENINKIIVPAKWVESAYIEDLPELKNKIIIWPAGVDTKYFCPDIKSVRDNVLIYLKNDPGNLLNETTDLLKELNIPYEIIKYGLYTKDEFKQKLDKAVFAIFFSKSESQGIALLESWSMNVPTLVWQSEDQLIIKGKTYNEFSSAPYLTADTGLIFNNINRLKEGLIKFKNPNNNFNPRKWVLNNMTDAISAQKLIDRIS